MSCEIWETSILRRTWSVVKFSLNCIHYLLRTWNFCWHLFKCRNCLNLSVIINFIINKRYRRFHKIWIYLYSRNKETSLESTRIHSMTWLSHIDFNFTVCFYKQLKLSEKQKWVQSIAANTLILSRLNSVNLDHSWIADRNFDKMLRSVAQVLIPNVLRQFDDDNLNMKTHSCN